MEDIKIIKAELIELRKQIRRHNKKYYEEDNPEISDYEYDQLMQRLKKIEADYPEFITSRSPTQMVGGKAKRTAGKLVPHDVPMLSLQDVFSRTEVEDFVNSAIEKLGSPEFVVEEKIDGLSLALRYNAGEFVQAITRGDGIIQGEDVTENARVIEDVVQYLKDKPEYFEVRGEVYMTRKNFEAVNARQELLGLKTFANPRNCAAGTLRQLDSRIVKERNLSIFVFNLQTSTTNFESHSAAYEFTTIKSARPPKKFGRQLKLSAALAAISIMILMAQLSRLILLPTVRNLALPQNFLVGQLPINTHPKRKRPP